MAPTGGSSARLADQAARAIRFDVIFVNDLLALNDDRRIVDDALVLDHDGLFANDDFLLRDRVLFRALFQFLNQRRINLAGAGEALETFGALAMRGGCTLFGRT